MVARAARRRATTVAFQGEAGAYSEQAARKLLGPDATTLPCPDFPAVFDAVRGGTADFGLLPVENSLAGTGNLQDNWDTFATGSFDAVGEVVLRVRHCLLALPGTRLSDLREISSHPQALAQCRGYIERLGKARAVPAYDTAGAARLVAQSGRRDAAAIASSLCAAAYGLEILDEGIEDNPHNFTRFVLAARRDAKGAFPALPEAAPGPWKTSIVFVLRDAGSGALFRALGAFALRDIDLARIESRPLHGSPWQYRFFADLRISAQDPRCRRALEHLGEMCVDLRVIGSFPAAPEGCITQPPLAIWPESAQTQARRPDAGLSGSAGASGPPAPSGSETSSRPRPAAQAAAKPAKRSSPPSAKRTEAKPSSARPSPNRRKPGGKD